MLKKILVAMILVGAVSNKMCIARATDDFVFVAPDSTLANLKKTREQANKECPTCEKRWRDAWKTEGTKEDTPENALIRNSTMKRKS